MAVYSKQLLSGSTNGQGVVLSQTATAGNLIHTAVSGTSSLDEVWLYATNTQATTATVTIEYGNANTTGSIAIDVAGDAGLTLLVPGLLINNGLEIRGFADTTNVITVYGYVNRIA